MRLTRTKRPVLRAAALLLGSVLALSAMTGCSNAETEALGEERSPEETAEGGSSSGSFFDPEEYAAFLEDAAVEKNTQADSVDELDASLDATYDSILDLLNVTYPRNDYTRTAYAFSDNGMRYYTDIDRYTSRCGVDISEFNGEIDWEAVRNAGFSFAVIRIGYRGYGSGDLTEDALFAQNLAGAQAAGLDVGVYFFAQAVTADEAAEEARFVLDLLDGADLQLPVFYDPESITTDDARTDSVTGGQFTDNTAAFCRTIADAGYEAGYYTNLKWEVFMLDMDKLKDYTVWYAGYTSYPETPFAFSFWQYSDKGTVPGIETTTDLDLQMIPVSP